MTTLAPETTWSSGRLDGRKGPRRVLFGQMYEDPAIELRTFPKGGRICCIASAGCTAMALAPHHEVVAIDINDVQLQYASQRFAGRAAQMGTAERIMNIARRFSPLVGWTRSRILSFLDMNDPVAQVNYWNAHLNTRRFRLAFDAILSFAALRLAYSPDLLNAVPNKLGAAIRNRMLRCFSTHPNNTNPFARSLLSGELINTAPPPSARQIDLVHSDAAGFLESQPPGSFDGFTLSNIMDGATAKYSRRLLAAVRHAARPNAMLILRSFREPSAETANMNVVSEERTFLWGTVLRLSVSHMNIPF